MCASAQCRPCARTAAVRIRWPDGASDASGSRRRRRGFTEVGRPGEEGAPLRLGDLGAAANGVEEDEPPEPLAVGLFRRTAAAAAGGRLTGQVGQFGPRLRALRDAPPAVGTFSSAWRNGGAPVGGCAYRRIPGRWRLAESARGCKRDIPGRGRRPSGPARRQRRCRAARLPPGRRRPGAFADRPAVPWHDFMPIGGGESAQGFAAKAVERNAGASIPRARPPRRCARFSARPRFGCKVIT